MSKVAFTKIFDPLDAFGVKKKNKKTQQKRAAKEKESGLDAERHRVSDFALQTRKSLLSGRGVSSSSILG